MDDFEGSVWAFGDHVNTDVIHPPEFFSLDPERVKRGLFYKHDPELQPRLSPNDIVVAGRNFGCGSSRETSIRSIKLNKIGAIVAVDFARIFFRSATNNGVPCLSFADPADAPRIMRARRARVSLSAWTLTTDSGEVARLSPVADFILEIWRAGGLLETLPGRTQSQKTAPPVQQVIHDDIKK